MSKFRLIKKITKIIPLATLPSLSTASEVCRSQARNRRFLLSTIASLIGKIIAVLTSLISIPLTLHYLGTERFGLWMTMSSLIAMLGFADLGIGNGLLNSVADANGRDDIQAIKQYISSAFVILGAISILCLLLFLIISPFVNWAAFFNVKSTTAIYEVKIAIAVFIICFALNIPASIVQRTQLGLQIGFISNLWQIVASLSSLISVLAIIHLKLGLPWLVGAMAGAPLAASTINTIIFFSKTRADLRPRIKFVSRKSCRSIANTGILFFVLQIVVSITYASDNIVIAKLLGSDAVTQYAVPEKLFAIIPMIVNIFLMPLWPAYGEAISRKDIGWVRKTFIKAILFSFFISTTLALFFVFFFRELISLWVGGEVSPPVILIIGFGLWKIIETVGTNISIILNGANIIKLQLSVALITATTALGLKIFLVNKVGIAGVVWATLITYFLFALIPYVFYIKKLLRKIGGND